MHEIQHAYILVNNNAASKGFAGHGGQCLQRDSLVMGGSGVSLEV